ncbi:MAG TPA: hypothetical protein OIL92_04285 [Oscillospiraceae bacterium]|nr:hypothetical protein [Oscillospiraceae bacterium]
MIANKLNYSATLVSVIIAEYKNKPKVILHLPQKANPFHQIYGVWIHITRCVIDLYFMQIKKFPMNYRIANFVRNFKKRDVKGFALKTHEGLRPSTLQAFEKA